jgi:hypothetical protein
MSPRSLLFDLLYLIHVMQFSASGNCLQSPFLLEEPVFSLLARRIVKVTKHGSMKNARKQDQKRIMPEKECYKEKQERIMEGIKN